MAIITNKKVIETHLKTRIKHSIELLIPIITNKCTAAELCHFIASLNFINVDEVKGNPEKNYHILRQNLTDVYKYLISLLACVKNLPTSFENIAEKEKIDGLTDWVRGIHDKFYALNASKYYSKVTLNTESNQIKIEIDELDSNPFIKTLNSYGIRIQEDLNKELQLKTFEIGIAEALDDYLAYDDLLEIGFGITVSEIKEILLRLKKELDIRFTNEYDNFSFKAKDIIDSKDYNNHILYTSLSIYSRDHLIKLHPKAKEFLRIFTFIPDEFDPFELRYNYIDKKSIIIINDLYFISFELIFNSLHSGLHYSLLDSEEITEKYKKRESSLFEEKISEVALKYGYETIERNIELYEGKRKLGDIDLVLKNEVGRKIYIEAKSYSLHSNIQAHDPIEMQIQLDRQKLKWESKVLSRKLHLERDKNNEIIEYIIVTRKPEILSHFSKLLVLNLREFDFWLKNSGNKEFETIYNDLYVSKEQISEKILNEISPNWTSK